MPTGKYMYLSLQLEHIHISRLSSRILPVPSSLPLSSFTYPPKGNHHPAFQQRVLAFPGFVFCIYKIMQHVIVFVCLLPSTSCL